MRPGKDKSTRTIEERVMPIPAEQLEIGLDDTDTMILGFLCLNRGEAFEPLEIAEWLGYEIERWYQRLRASFVLRLRLDQLVSRGLIERKELNGRDHYRRK
jgi:hypothetical protein